MSEEMRTFGYLCPACGQTVMGTRSVFALEASNAEIECSCGKSSLDIGFDGEKYHITVPCGICGETHTAICGPERILQGATALGCAQTKQFCCFIGPEGTVEKNLRELAILAEKEKQQEGEGNQEAFVDNVIMYEVLSELKDIAARKDGITCGCGSHRYGMGDPPFCGGSDLPGLRRQASHSRCHRPGSGRSVLPPETGHSREAGLTARFPILLQKGVSLHDLTVARLFLKPDLDKLPPGRPTAFSAERWALV